MYFCTRMKYFHKIVIKFKGKMSTKLENIQKSSKLKPQKPKNK